jgi:hypothetical protein
VVVHRSDVPPALVADATKAYRLLGWVPVRSEYVTIVQTAWHWNIAGLIHTQLGVARDARAPVAVLAPAGEPPVALCTGLVSASTRRRPERCPYVIMRPREPEMPNGRSAWAIKRHTSFPGRRTSTARLAVMTSTFAGGGPSLHGSASLHAPYSRDRAPVASDPVLEYWQRPDNRQEVRNQ